MNSEEVEEQRCTISEPGLIPSFALLFYKGNNGSDASFVESAQFTEKKGRFHLDRGTPLTASQAIGLGKALSQSKDQFISTKGFINKNLLYFKSGFKPDIIWVKPEGIQQGIFAESLGIPSGLLMYPNIVFQVEPLRVYAVKSIHNLNENTELYKIPLPNISEDGNVCLGNVKRPRKSHFVEDIIKAYEASFFNSEFNSFHDRDIRGRQVGAISKVNLPKFWTRMTTAKEFDYSALAKSPHKTLGTLLKNTNDD